MRHLKGGRKLGRPSGHRAALIRNQVTDLLRYERIRTTLPKAREVQRASEKLIASAREDSVHARRLAAARLYDVDVLSKLFAEIGPKFADRHGGYTRLTRLGFRRGDSAPMAQLELLA